MKDKFKELMIDILEIKPDLFDIDADFRVKYSGWDSLKGFATLVMLEESFGLKLNVNNFIKLKTLREIYNLILKNE